MSPFSFISWSLLLKLLSCVYWLSFWCRIRLWLPLLLVLLILERPYLNFFTDLFVWRMASFKGDEKGSLLSLVGLPNVLFLDFFIKVWALSWDCYGFMSSSSLAGVFTCVTNMEGSNTCEEVVLSRNIIDFSMLLNAASCLSRGLCGGWNSKF